MKYIDEYKNPEAAAVIRESIRNLASEIPSDRTVKIMEVCGSHTMAIARYALNTILPKNIKLISGPGCPVCVTDAGYIDTAIELCKEYNVIIVTFGDMINVPGSNSSLAKTRAEGGDIQVCYSCMEAIETAKKKPDKEVVFLGIGFETTIAPIASVMDWAIKNKIGNLSVLTAFKLVPPALYMLAEDKELQIDAFLCPAHVSAIIGAQAYEPFVNKYKIPCVIASFEPLDILLGIQKILEQIITQTAFVDNQYGRVVKYSGNTIAKALINKFLEPCDAVWRGIGEIPNSGLKFRKDFSQYDSECRFNISMKTGTQDQRCKCGDILKGKITPDECPMFNTVCTPLSPIGPCMVSSEGTCAAYYKYLK